MFGDVTGYRPEMNDIIRRVLSYEVEYSSEGLRYRINDIEVTEKEFMEIIG